MSIEMFNDVLNVPTPTALLSNPSSPTAVNKDAAIPTGIHYLKQDIGILAARLNCLAEKLNPILKITPPTNSLTKGDEVKSLQAPLVSDLADIDICLRKLTSGVDSLIERLEL